ncbi:MAG: hypothetical protein NVS1B4_25450 [Gemmatimonadaceae bacterium]
MRRAPVAIPAVLIAMLSVACRDQRSATGVDRALTTSSGIPAAQDDAADAESQVQSEGEGEVLRAHLSPRNEVPPVASAALGRAQITFTGENTIVWTVRIANPAHEAFFAGHIHAGAAGTNGPVRRFLFDKPIGDTSDPLVVTGGPVMIAPDLAAGLRARPGDFYVNFHTLQFKGGATRGQLTGDDGHEEGNHQIGVDVSP